MAASEDVFSLKQSLEAALNEIDNELDAVDDDDEQANEHIQTLQDRREQIQDILLAFKDKYENNKEEVELREELSAEDNVLVRERLSGRRIAHVQNWNPCHAKVASERWQASVIKDKIVERPKVDERKVLLKESDTSRRVLMAEIEKKMMGERVPFHQSKTDAFGIYPPTATDGEQ